MRCCIYIQSFIFFLIVQFRCTRSPLGHWSTSSTLETSCRSYKSSTHSEHHLTLPSHHFSAPVRLHPPHQHLTTLRLPRHHHLSRLQPQTLSRPPWKSSTHRWKALVCCCLVESTSQSRHTEEHSVPRQMQ